MVLLFVFLQFILHTFTLVASVFPRLFLLLCLRQKALLLLFPLRVAFSLLFIELLPLVLEMDSLLRRSSRVGLHFR